MGDELMAVLEDTSTFKDIEKVLQIALQRDGLSKQKLVWCEELSELTKAITKEARYGLTDKAWADIVEEISDVLICVIEMMILYHVRETTIIPSMGIKIKRTLERLSSYNVNDSANTDSQGNANTKD